MSFVDRTISVPSLPVNGRLKREDPVPINWRNDTLAEVYHIAGIFGCDDKTLSRRSLYLVVTFERQNGTGSFQRTGVIYHGTNKTEVDQRVDQIIKPPKGFGIHSVKVHL